MNTSELISVIKVAFITDDATRSDGSKFKKLDESIDPVIYDILHNFVMESHQGKLPNDFMYKTISIVVDEVLENPDLIKNGIDFYDLENLNFSLVYDSDYYDCLKALDIDLTESIGDSFYGWISGKYLEYCYEIATNLIKLIKENSDNESDENE